MPALLDELSRLREQSERDLAQVRTLQDLDGLQVKYLGRQAGLLTQLLRQLPSLSQDDKKALGQSANEFKKRLEAALASKKRDLEEADLEESLRKASLDLTLPGTPILRGRPHPLSQTLGEITACFTRLGFESAFGPEVETDFNNFSALNHPPDHPARDAHDTFYIKGLRDEESKPLLLRTHTSPVQIRTMKGRKPPVYVVAPGRVFRHEAVDATHSFVFHQVEGLAVDKGVSMADLKGVLSLFARQLFGAKSDVRFRPSFFPFVEPGIEVDITCVFCEARGCRICKQTGWVEMLGAGMVHPNVFRAVGYDPAEVTGYAFGIGVERVAMFKHGVDDMRLFYENDVRFLRQF